MINIPYFSIKIKNLKTILNFLKRVIFLTFEARF
jgi:hypothetical protein